MKSANISEVRDRFSEYLRIVRRGETVIILDRDSPVARLEPMAPGIPNEPHTYRNAVAAGILTPPRLSDDLLHKLPEPPKTKKPARLVEAILAERRSGR